jgi:bifunctional enzyme CysN/CysC
VDPRYDASTETIDEYLAKHEEKALLRFLTCGSVDDGKSTLIGRLLHDTKAIYEDQLAAVRNDSRKHGTQGTTADLSLLVDGLRSEREQGITIDVAYRYFSTDQRKFIVADTPGHEQYTRNMATGASTCDLAVLLVDARLGVSAQTRRHAIIASLLGIPRVVVAVNKMDLVEWKQDVFNSICAEFEDFASRLPERETWFIPMSALDGDNVAERSNKTPYYDGPCLLELLESVPVNETRQDLPLRMPVQYVIRPDLNYRGFGGRIESGVVRPGDRVVVLPSGATSRVKRITTFDGDLQIAGAPRSVSLVLEDEIDASRGDMIALADDPPLVGARLSSTLVWMHESPLIIGREYILRHGTKTTPCRVRKLRHRLDIESLDRIDATTLTLNEIGVAELQTDDKLAFDPYSSNRATGAIVLIDRVTHATVAAGMLSGLTRETRWTANPVGSERLHARTSLIEPGERSRRLGHAPATLLLTGLAGSGKTSIATRLARVLFDDGHTAIVLDGQTMRLGLNRDLGFSALDRSENLRRSMEMAKVINAQGLLCIAAFVAPISAMRAQAATLIGREQFLEIYCARSIDSCREQDTSGVYAAAERGELEDVPGISFEYEAPAAPDLALDAGTMDVDECVERIIGLLHNRSILT